MEQWYTEMALTDEVMAGLRGTWTLAVTPAAPFPAASWTFPRTKAVDGWVEQMVAMLNQDAPAEGASLALAIPDLPIPLTLVHGKDAYLLTSVAIDLRISEIVDMPNFVVTAHCPLSIFD
jgi:hypothetical protein